MYRHLEDTAISAAVRQTLIFAAEEYCAALHAISDEFDRGRAASSEQLERALEAMLQLENAETLLELDVSRRRDALTPRKVH